MVEPSPVTTPGRGPKRAALLALPLALAILLVLSLTDASRTQWFFVHTTYYVLMAGVLCWVGVHLQAARGLRRETVVAWVRDNWPGLILAAAVMLVAAAAVEPALRMLSDEANLVGTSKNFFASRTATFTVSGKYYYDSYWDVNVAIDRRPTLFPFLVSLVHAVRGYSYRNVFAFNLLVLGGLVLISYRLAKSIGGEVFAIVASIFVVAHPITIISARSGGFDVFATFFALVVVKSLFDHLRQPSPEKLAMLWMNLCLFAELRYETALFIPPMLALLLIFERPTRSALAPHACLYVLTPAFLFPRLWQAILRGSIPEQDPGDVALSAQNFVSNASEYFQPILSPFEAHPAHSAPLIALGIVGTLAGLRWLWRRARAREWKTPQARLAAVVAVWMALQVIISFTYVWGRAQHPSAARLVISIDTFFSFAAAWAVTAALERWRPLGAVLLAVAVLLVELPVASQHRMLNRLTQTRESATTWRFFERLGEKQILIVTDRPNLFTIMDYGAMSFEEAKNDRFLFTAFARHLFYDVYVIQQIGLSTNQPLPGYEIWPDRKLEPVLEFQNDADVLVRISRLGH